ncbi:MAG: YihY/virulence factor BrkB family protein [Actinomycetota bacterium]
MATITQIPQKAAAAKARLRSRFGFVDVAFATTEAFSEDDGGPYSAALTYYMFFSIFPMLMFAVAALGFVLAGNPELKQDILEAGFDAFPMVKDLLLPRALQRLEENRQEIASIGVLLALYSGTGGVAALEHALNVMLDVPREEEPGFLGKRVRALRWLGALGAAVIVSVALGSVATFARHLFGVDKGSVAAGVLAHAAGFVVGVGLFAVTYKFLPARRQSWRTVLPGAILAAAVFELLKTAGGSFLRQATEGREATFGAFSIAAALLVASYVMAQVVLLAAELNGVLAARAGRRPSTDRDDQGRSGG